MVRNIIKQVYLSIIFVFNKLFKSNVKRKNVVIFMTFKEDVLPIIGSIKEGTISYYSYCTSKVD
ncbi:hypothetical protein NIT60_00130 [Mammaliicoccus sciuri]|nr:hypothetical protein NIT60_00130 [Mammaliicoccus sciuri]